MCDLLLTDSDLIVIETNFMKQNNNSVKTFFIKKTVDQIRFAKRTYAHLDLKGN